MFVGEFKLVELFVDTVENNLNRTPLWLSGATWSVATGVEIMSTNSAFASPDNHRFATFFTNNHMPERQEDSPEVFL